MSMLDCPECWDCPCECGAQSYLVVYNERLPKLNRGDFERVRDEMKAWLAKRLDEPDMRWKP